MLGPNFTSAEFWGSFMFRLLRPFPMTILVALLIALAAIHSAHAANSLIQDSPEFALRPAKWSNGDVVVFQRLNKDAPLTPEIIQDTGKWITRETAHVQLFEVRAAMQMRVSVDELTRDGFWDFNNLGKVLTDLQFKPQDRDERTFISYPVRETTLGFFPKRMNCQLVQKRYTPQDARFQIAWNRWTSAQRSSVPEPVLLVIQECRDFNLMFQYSTQSLFFIPNGNRTDVLVDARAYARRETIQTLDMIPFLNVANKMGGTILKEVVAFRSSIEAYFQR